MKKALLIALAGMMLFAFTQCTGGGSKEFQDYKKAINEMTKVLNNAKTCEDLESIYDIEENMEGIVYEENEKITPEEDSELEKLFKELFKLWDEKEEKLCK